MKKTTWYSYEKIIFNNKERCLESIRLPNNYLWSKRIYKTKITAKDLPESFIYGRFYKTWGYIDTAGIVDMYYKPNLHFNHFLKDDCLVISYTGKIKKVRKKIGTITYDEFENESHRIYGNEIIDILKGARKYSDYDIKPFIKKIKDKLKWLKENHPKEFGNYEPDIDKIFSEPINRTDCHFNHPEL